MLPLVRGGKKKTWYARWLAQEAGSGHMARQQVAEVHLVTAASLCTWSAVGDKVSVLLVQTCLDPFKVRFDRNKKKQSNLFYSIL